MAELIFAASVLNLIRNVPARMPAVKQRDEPNIRLGGVDLLHGEIKARCERPRVVVDPGEIAPGRDAKALVGGADETLALILADHLQPIMQSLAGGVEHLGRV